MTNVYVQDVDESGELDADVVEGVVSELVAVVAVTVEDEVRVVDTVEVVVDLDVVSMQIAVVDVVEEASFGSNVVDVEADFDFPNAFPKPLPRKFFPLPSPLDFVDLGLSSPLCGICIEAPMAKKRTNRER